MTSSPSSSEEVVPLQDTWSLWFDRYIGPGYSADEYAAAMLHVCAISDIQTFWCWFNNLPSAHSLEASCTYHLMKKNIRPVWEDEANLHGGSFSIKVPLKENLDSVWILLALTAVSGQFDHFMSSFNNAICGVSINMRKSEAMLTVWSSNAKTFDIAKVSEYLLSILREVYQTISSDSFSYRVHSILENFGNQSQPKESVTKSPIKTVPQYIVKESPNERKKKVTSFSPRTESFPRNQVRRGNHWGR